MKTILISVKASEKLPKNLSKRYPVSYGDGTFGDIFGGIDEWDYMLSEYPNLVWYKEVSEEKYLQKGMEVMMPKGKKPTNRKELSLWNYWDATTSEQRIDIVQRAFKLIEVQNKYIELLGEELDELAILAHNRGWRSKRAEQGEQMRKEMELLTREEE